MSTDPSYTYPNSTTVALNTETTYDWNAEEATANAAKQPLRYQSDQRLSRISGLISSFDK